MRDYTKEIDQYLKRLFPICRSITGEGNRETLKILSEIAPIVMHEVPSGTQVYDWRVPQEWNIRAGWIKNSQGEKIVDFKESNLHVVSYSIAVHQKMKGRDLAGKLHTLKNMPDAIPYRTSYYKQDWGFCLSFEDYQKYISDDEEYEVYIDADLKAGSLTYGEILIPGKSAKEYLISTYICHPSLANDNLSGPILTAFLAKELFEKELQYSYRFVFIPETIGAICYCALHEETIKNMEAGLVVTTVGGPGGFSYKKSFDETHYMNRLADKVLSRETSSFKAYSFDCHGSDERQYSAPGFRLNMVGMMKDKYYEYSQYHTSLDNLDFIKAENVAQSLGLFLDLVSLIEARVVYQRIENNGELMLSKHDLYPSDGGGQIPGQDSEAKLNGIVSVLFWCDGINSVEDIAMKTGLDVEFIKSIFEILEAKKVVVI